MYKPFGKIAHNAGEAHMGAQELGAWVQFPGRILDSCDVSFCRLHGLGCKTVGRACQHITLLWVRLMTDSFILS
jgi:hypothetical protein